MEIADLVPDEKEQKLALNSIAYSAFRLAIRGEKRKTGEYVRKICPYQLKVIKDACNMLIELIDSKL